MELRKSLRVIEDYKQASPHYVDLLNILSTILVLREQFLIDLQEDVFIIDEKYIKAKLEGGMPLVDMSQNINLEFPEKYFRALLESLKEKFPEEMKFFNECIDEKFTYRELLVAYKMIKAGKDDDSLSPDLDCVEETDLSDEEDLAEAKAFDMVSMLLRESLRPGFNRVITRYSSLLAEQTWQEGFCPVCGSQPRIGEIKGEEGHRHLYCHQCGYEWIFPRIMCPFCGNNDQHSLFYFTVDGNENYRVDTCNKCRQYIKVVDLRNKEREANLEIEDIATIHLDIIANDEGYE